MKTVLVVICAVAACVAADWQEDLERIRREIADLKEKTRQLREDINEITVSVDEEEGKST